MRKLPRELRDEIYQLALCVPDSLPVDFTTANTPCKNSSLLSYTTALMSTCKEVRAESFRLFYSSNTFRFTVHCGYDRRAMMLSRAAKKWLDAIGPAACLSLRHVEVILSNYPVLWNLGIVWWMGTEIAAFQTVIKASASGAEVTLVLSIDPAGCGQDYLYLPLADFASAMERAKQTYASKYEQKTNEPFSLDQARYALRCRHESEDLQYLFRSIQRAITR